MSEQFDLIQFFHENTKRNIYYMASDPDISTKPSPFKEYPQNPSIKLPTDTFTLHMALDKAILSRRSCRNFSGKSLSLKNLSQLLWFGYGITEIILYEDLKISGRPVPSAGALNPFEIYPIVFNVNNVEQGVYHYCPIDHSLEFLKSGDFENHVSNLLMGQYYIAGSSVCFILTSVLNRITWKYGSRGYRYLLMEAGHIVQNLCLVATAQKLGTLPLGGFFDNALAEFIDVNPDLEPIQYCLAIGSKAS